jgi:ribosomal protein S1
MLGNLVLSLAWLGGPSVPQRSAIRGVALSGAKQDVRMAEATAPLDLYKPPSVSKANLKVGQVVSCVVLGKIKAENSTRSPGYSVDIGAEEPAFVPRGQVALRPNATVSREGKAFPFIRNGWAELPPGMVIEGQVIGVSDSGINISLARRASGVAWNRVEQLAAEDLTVTATVLQLSDAGATLDVEGMPAYLPWSHWALPMSERSYLVHGTKLPVKFLEVDRERKRLVVSNRRVRLEGALAKIEPGGLVSGTIKDVKDFGAIVSLDEGFEGLLHVSQVSQLYVSSPRDCLAVGDKVRCVVIRVDAEDGAIALSTKMLEDKPGEMMKDPQAVYARAAAKLLADEGSS